MIYLKSVVVGLLVVFLGAVVVAATILIRIWTAHSGVFTMALNLRSPFLWGVLLLIFGAGFYWEYRRTSS